jgi:anti-sigma-K factor RskA
MSTGHVDELIEEYALGLLDGDEAAQVEAHLAGCAACRAKVDAALHAAAHLAAVAPPAAPAAETAQRLFERVRQAPRARNAPRRVPAAAPPQPQPRQGWLWPAAAGLGLALAVAMVIWNFSLQAQLGRLAQDNQALADRLRRQEARVALVSGAQVAVVEMGGTEDAPEAQGRAYVDQAEGTAWITVSGLPAVTDDWTYQVWLIGADGPVSAGFLGPANDGRREVWLSNVDGLASYQAVGVSLEQAGGSAHPTKVMTVGGF